MTNNVATGHCRRRKIRCIPSNDPSETKCANCIRLKKECQFYPVDQNCSNTRKHRSNSRTEPLADEPTVARSSTSPDQPPTSISDSFETSYAGRTSSSSAWADSAGVVTSPRTFILTDVLMLWLTPFSWTPWIDTCCRSTRMDPVATTKLVAESILAVQFTCGSDSGSVLDTEWGQRIHGLSPTVWNSSNIWLLRPRT